MELIIIIILALLGSAFFSGIEIAFLSANKLMLQLSKEKGDGMAKLLHHITRAPSHFIGTTLIGNNISLVLLGIFSAMVICPAPPVPADRLVLIPSTGSSVYDMLIQTGITTFIVLIFGEFIPKNLFRQKPSAFLRFFVLPFAFIYFLLYPLVWAVLQLVKFILKSIWKVEPDDNELMYSRLDLLHIVDFSHNEEEPDQDLNKEIFENALQLKEVKVRECMVPRNEIDALELQNGMLQRNEVIDFFHTTKRSRILVFEEDLDNVLGYIHHFDLILGKTNMKEIIHPLPVVPESMKVQDVLDELNQVRKNVALVVDEFGGTAGIVTMEDILEEVFGEIEDEHDEDDLVVRQISEYQFVLSGRVEVDYLNEEYGLKLPEGEYETLSGFILEHMQRIPEKNEHIEIYPFIFKILRVSQNRIETLRLDIPHLQDLPNQD